MCVALKSKGKLKSYSIHVFYVYKKMKNVAFYVWLIVQIGKLGVLWFGTGKQKFAMALWRVFHTNGSCTV